MIKVESMFDDVGWG